jgi:hypothetical protein
MQAFIWAEIRGMNPPFAVGCIVLGAAFIAVGLTAKKFYAVKGMNLKVTDREVDTLAGRIGFCIIGGLAILLGELYLLFHHWE